MCLLSVKVTVKDSVKCKYYELNVYGVHHNKVTRKVFPSGIIVGKDSVGDMATASRLGTVQKKSYCKNLNWA